MKLKALLPVLVLAAFSVSCDQETPTVPDDTAAVPADVPLFAKPNCEVDPSHPSCKDVEDPKQAPYEFVYDFTDDRDGGSSSFVLDSDCVLMLPGPGPDGYGRTYWCDVSEPIFRLKVVDTSTNAHVTEGTVAWKLCKHVDGYAVDWTKCGVGQRGKRVYHAVYFDEYVTTGSGVFEVTLTNWVAGQSVWGMSWAYWDDDKPKPDIETKFKDLACVDYRNSFDGPFIPCPAP